MRRVTGVVEVVIGASIIVALALFFIFGAASGGFAAGGSGAAAWAAYYGRALGGSFVNFLYWSILFFCLVVTVLVIWSLGSGFFAIFFPRRTRQSGHGKHDQSNQPGNTPREVFLAAASRSREMFLILPAILFVAIVGLAMGQANAFAPARLKDQMVIGWEHALFGNYVFAALGAIHYPHWLILFIIFSFENMALILIIAGIILAYVARQQFRELLVAFCIGILAMVPLWLMIPVLSPQDRFINNVYHLSMPPTIAAAVANYHPQPEIAAFLQTIRTEKAGLPALPTSTIPSAHVFWATLTGYYLFRVRRRWRWLGWIALPFLLASTFGTVLLAQHYFFDVPAGLAVAALAIWLAYDITSAASRGTSDESREAVYR